MSEEYKHAEIIGPFTEPEWCYVKVNGCKVPHIRVRKLTGESDGRIEVHMDSNCWIIDANESDVILNMLAVCMARAAGFNNIGPDSEPYNPYRKQFIGLSTDESK